MRKIITSLDIGSDTIKLAVGEFFENDFFVLAASEVKTEGFKDGEVVNESLLVKSINKVLEKTKEKLSFDVKKIVLNIPYENYFFVSDANIRIEGEDFRVTGDDIINVTLKSTKRQIPANEELIGALPVFFRVDQVETDSPYGLRGKNLYLKNVLVTAVKDKVYKLIKVIEKCNLEVVDITSTGLVDYYNFKSNKLDTSNSVVINIGHNLTNLSIFSNGIYLNNEIMNTGGIDIIRDIAYKYNLDLDISKKLLETYALADTKNSDFKNVIKLENLNNEMVIINQYEISAVVNKRLEEMLNNIKNTINHLTKKEISYIIITGGVTEVEDFRILLNRVFGNVAKIGHINELGSRNNKYSVSLGMIKYFNEKLKLRHKEYSTITEDDLESMLTEDKGALASDSIIGKVFSWFFDN